MNLSELNKHKQQKKLKEVVTDFKTISYAKLKGTACDPDKAILVSIYDTKNPSNVRQQLLKRRKLINRVIMFDGADGQLHLGKIVAFSTETGAPVIYPKDDVAPVKNTKILVVFNPTGGR